MTTKPKRMFVLLEVDTTLTTKEAKSAFAALIVDDVEVVQVTTNVAAKLSKPAE